MSYFRFTKFCTTNEQKTQKSFKKFLGLKRDIFFSAQKKIAKHKSITPKLTPKYIEKKKISEKIYLLKYHLSKKIFKKTIFTKYIQMRFFKLATLPKKKKQKKK